MPFWSLKPMSERDIVYLDANASTPVDPRVVSALLRVTECCYANAASSHRAGQETRRLLECARQQVASLIGAVCEEIVFTSGATESINMALKGVVWGAGVRPLPVVTTRIEHVAVLNTLRWLEARGDVAIFWAGVDRRGGLGADELRRVIPAPGSLVCVTHGNGEVGTVNNLEALGDVASSRGAVFFVDAAQTGAYYPPDVRACPVQLMALSAHKMHGPKGVGALFVKRGLILEPQMHGGGQEQGLRPGTVNVPGAIGMGVAAELAQEKGSERAKNVSALREKFLSLIVSKISGVRMNGDLVGRLPGNLSLTLAGVEGAALRRLLPELSFSQGSACSSGAGRSSHVLRGIGLSEDECACTIRIGLSAMSDEGEVEAAALRIAEICRRLRQL